MALLFEKETVEVQDRSWDVKLLCQAWIPEWNGGMHLKLLD